MLRHQDVIRIHHHRRVAIRMPRHAHATRTPSHRRDAFRMLRRARVTLNPRPLPPATMKLALVKRLVRMTYVAHSRAVERPVRRTGVYLWDAGGTPVEPQAAWEMRAVQRDAH